MVLGAATLIVLSTTELPLARADEPAPAADAAAPGEETALVLPRPNQGLFIGAAVLSAGAFGFDAARPDRKLTSGVAGSLLLGGSVTDWLDLGVGMAYGETFGAEDKRLKFGRMTLHSQWYLNPRWFARLDLGAGSVAGQDPNDARYDRGGYGEVYSVGVGHNLYLSPATQSGGFVLSPVLGVDVTPSDGLTAVVGWFGLELSYWTGLSRDKLRLPVDRAYE
jgi:hypothetical protein